MGHRAKHDSRRPDFGDAMEHASSLGSSAGHEKSGFTHKLSEWFVNLFKQAVPAQPELCQPIDVDASPEDAELFAHIDSNVELYVSRLAECVAIPGVSAEPARRTRWPTRPA